jgi:hypothetical protein
MQDASAIATIVISEHHGIRVHIKPARDTMDDTGALFGRSECNRPSLDMLNMTMCLDGANGKACDSLESQKRNCGQAGCATPCGYEV